MRKSVRPRVTCKRCVTPTNRPGRRDNMADETKPRSTLAMLREQVPPRPLTGYEVRQVLDRQATRLLKLSETFGPPVPIEAIATALPRVVVKRVDDLPSS